MKTKPAAPNGRELEVARALFRDQVVFGPEVPPMALMAARSAGFDPAHHTVDAQILKFVTANYGLNYQHDRPPHLWERGSADVKLAELYGEEDRLRAEYEQRLTAMWSSRDELSGARRADGGSSAEAIAVATKQLDAAIKAWQRAKAALETAMGKRSDRQQWLQEAYRRRAAAEGK